MKSFLLFFLLPLVINSKPHSFLPKDDNVTCGYQSCPNTYSDKLNVHLISHSHDDLGWLMTVDQYFYTEVQYVLSSVIPALKQDPSRRFIQVETYYLYQWWQLQEDNVKQDVIDLINEGRLEIINGGWCMNDEAATHYQSIIDQLTIGHRQVDEMFGKCGRPKIGWSIDPFGHSREQASIFSQMGFDAFLVGRIDYRDDDQRKSDKTTDLLWSASSNFDANLFSSIIYRAYNNPPNFCFDINCNDPKINDDEESPDYNLDERVDGFVNYIKDQAATYPTNNILVTMGDDVQYQNAFTNYANIDKLIKGFKKFNPKIDDREINIFYSTPSCYVKAVHDFVVENEYELKVKSDDFFPYATTSTGLWTGFYTSRPTSKRYERIANNVLQAAKQLTALAKLSRDTTFKLESAVGIMQHHDAITGTEKSIVEKDYHRLLSWSIDKTLPNINSALQELLKLDDSPNWTYCPLANITICGVSEADSFNVLLYNPLGTPITHYPQIPVRDGKWRVVGPNGDEIPSELVNPVRDFSYVGNDLGVKVLDKYVIFKAELPSLGYNIYHLEKINNVNTKHQTEINNLNQMAGYDNNYVELDDKTGLVTSMTINGETLKVQQEIMYYNGSYGSGAYMFIPDSNTHISITDTVTNTIVQSDILTEIRQEFNSWASQVIRIYPNENHIEFDWTVGPIDVSDGQGKDVITRWTTDLKTQSIFYTDANGRELQKRQRDFRPTYNYTNEAPASGNYYPITSRIVLKDEAVGKEFGVITDRAQGASSLNDGQIEIMVHRALLRDEFSLPLRDHLDEQEYGTGIIARGSFYVTFGDSKSSDNKVSSPAIQREIARNKHLLPLMLLSTDTLTETTKSFLTKDLPEEIRLLTFSKWNDDDNSYLLRLEHIFEKQDDDQLSQSVEIDFENLFNVFKITSAKEMYLNGVKPKDEDPELIWPTDNKKPTVYKLPKKLATTLNPMEIKTFIVKVE